MPGIQIYVIRILFICPVYAVCSAMALGLGDAGAYAEIGRDVYEAFVIYSFLNLILEYCGGETDCIYQIENEPQLRMPCPLCFLKPRPRDARLMRLCHRGVLQFIIVKPIVAIMDVIMIATDNYYKLPYQIFEFIVYNISYAWALYCMFVFYLATKQLIRKFRPVLKFATVKAIVFATYYQSLAVKASSMSPEDSYMWNDLILCVEMVLFSFLLMCAFPTSEFQGGIPDSRFIDNVKSVLSVHDVMQDVYHNFMPVYQDYALQRSEKETPEVVRMRTYLAGNLDSVAIEMSHRYRGRNKRLAFNSLLRGATPIRARPRSRKGHRRQTSTTSSEYSEESDIGSSEHSDSSSSSIFPCRMTYYSSLHTETMGDMDIECSGENMDTISPNSSHGLLQSQYGASCHSNEHAMNPVQKEILCRRREAMSTHGIGVVVSARGVEVHPPNYHPTEEERVLNEGFMGANDMTEEIISPLVSLAVNTSAANLPRLPKKALSAQGDCSDKDRRKYMDTFKVDNEIIPPLPRLETVVSRPVRAIPPPRRRSPSISPCSSPDIHNGRGERERGFVFDDNAVHPTIFMHDEQQYHEEDDEHWGEFVEHASSIGSGSRSRSNSVGHAPETTTDQVVVTETEPAYNGQVSVVLSENRTELQSKENTETELVVDAAQSLVSIGGCKDASPTRVGQGESKEGSPNGHVCVTGENCDQAIELQNSDSGTVENHFRLEKRMRQKVVKELLMRSGDSDDDSNNDSVMCPQN
eukprot:CAMPEP_0185029608 /NCGR_PEP_ID=MMETSP1103-20130426/16014_1 /TAXON_ID=36769 /ORGANISM="Paraphysomonas bandaiensis, Strain Caron Lab Isolate" /LENGTH=750 /DNA_ID=CAMNT_0027564417 /DNA_START=256 /DNA_END=2505 /DNA_ORIENTATION=-